MKNLCYSAFIAFWSSVATLLALHALATDEKTSPTNVFSLAEVAKHASSDDCWLAIEGKVYDVTAYLSKHPAPPSILADWCGKEATKGMRTKGYGRDHSPGAWQLLETYRLGNVGE